MLVFLRVVYFNASCVKLTDFVAIYQRLDGDFHSFLQLPFHILLVLIVAYTHTLQVNILKALVIWLSYHTNENKFTNHIMPNAFSII